MKLSLINESDEDRRRKERDALKWGDSMSSIERQYERAPYSKIPMLKEKWLSTKSTEDLNEYYEALKKSSNTLFNPKNGLDRKTDLITRSLGFIKRAEPVEGKPWAIVAKNVKQYEVSQTRVDGLLFKLYPHVRRDLYGNFIVHITMAPDDPWSDEHNRETPISISIDFKNYTLNMATSSAGGHDINQETYDYTRLRFET